MRGLRSRAIYGNGSGYDGTVGVAAVGIFATTSQVTLDGSFIQTTNN